MTPQERYVWHLHAVEMMNGPEIAEETGLPQSRISRILSRIYAERQNQD